VWAVIGEDPEKYFEADPVANVALPRLVRLEPRPKR
jgi:hypothetical protein